VSDTEPRDIADALQRMTRTQIACRARGHAWEDWRAHLFGRNGSRGAMEILRCSRCGSERQQDLDRFGTVVKGRYVYPDGYLVKGLGRLTGEDRGLVRLTSIRQTHHDG
jgi:hypothetical protein